MADSQSPQGGAADEPPAQPAATPVSVPTTMSAAQTASPASPGKPALPPPNLPQWGLNAPEEVQRKWAVLLSQLDTLVRQVPDADLKQVMRYLFVDPGQEQPRLARVKLRQEGQNVLYFQDKPRFDLWLPEAGCLTLLVSAFPVFLAAFLSDSYDENQFVQEDVWRVIKPFARIVTVPEGKLLCCYAYSGRVLLAHLILMGRATGNIPSATEIQDYFRRKAEIKAAAGAAKAAAETEAVQSAAMPIIIASPAVVATLKAAEAAVVEPSTPIAKPPATAVEPRPAAEPAVTAPPESAAPPKPPGKPRGRRRAAEKPATEKPVTAVRPPTTTDEGPPAAVAAVVPAAAPAAAGISREEAVAMVAAAARQAAEETAAKLTPPPSPVPPATPAVTTDPRLLAIREEQLEVERTHSEELRKLLADNRQQTSMLAGLVEKVMSLIGRLGGRWGGSRPGGESRGEEQTVEEARISVTHPTTTAWQRPSLTNPEEMGRLFRQEEP